ncbi:MAG: C39 family peptidase [Candidatus Pacebacteria bacterium]|nr:C39 family peptidase [Candidatus Paceibacterota bacterium]
MPRASRILKNSLANIDSVFHHKSPYIKKGIPYFSQWESPELNDDILNKKKDAAEDKKWKNSGANSPEEYRLWSWHTCGITCFKMILADILGKEFKTINLAKKCAKYGGFRKKGENIEGLYYLPFCRFVRKEFKLKIEFVRWLSIKRIKRELSQDNYVIATVNPNIRDLESSIPKKKGGHLVLVVGYDDKKKILFLHNPSGFYKKSQEYAEISEKNFKRFFAKRGVVVYS